MSDNSENLNVVTYQGKEWKVVETSPAVVSSPIATDGVMSNGVRLKLSCVGTGMESVAYMCTAEPSTCRVMFPRAESLRPHMKVHATRPVGRAVPPGALLELLSVMAEDLERTAGKVVDMLEDVSDGLADMGITMRQLAELEQAAENARSRTEVEAIRKTARELISAAKKAAR